MLWSFGILFKPSRRGRCVPSEAWPSIQQRTYKSVQSTKGGQARTPTSQGGQEEYLLQQLQELTNAEASTAKKQLQVRDCDRDISGCADSVVLQEAFLRQRAVASMVCERMLLLRRQLILEAVQNWRGNSIAKSARRARKPRPTPLPLTMP